MMYGHVSVLIVTLGAAALAAAGDAIAPEIAAAVGDSTRPAEQTRLDAQRKPGQLIAFAGIKAGDRIGDFMPGNAYFTRIFSKLVGPTGRVYAFIPDEQLKSCDPKEIAGSRLIEHDPAYRNVVQWSAPVNRFRAPQALDVLWISQNYHDLHDRFMGPADIKRVNRAFFDSLKPGGLMIVIDHAAAAGTGLRATETLHRIDPRSVRIEMEAAGFQFEAQFDQLRNPHDDHLRSVFDPAIQGNTDQFVYKFKKPDGAAGFERRGT